METGTRVQALPRAAWPPLLCALHCVASPLLLALAPALFSHPAIELGLAGVAALVSTGTIVRAVMAHRQWRVLVPLGAGLALWVLTLLEMAPLPEVLGMVSGGLLVASAVYLNGHIGPTTCGCESCEIHD